MGCYQAYQHRHDWYCSITGEKCIFMVPDISICSRLYGDEPDALFIAQEHDEDFY